MVQELLIEIRRANELLESLRDYPFIDEIEAIDADRQNESQGGTE